MSGGRPRRSWRTPRPRQQPDTGIEHRFTIDEVIDGDPPGERGDPIRLAWRELRLEMEESTMCGEYDPRRFLSLSDVERLEWRAARCAWLAERFRHDPRIKTEL